MATSEQGKINGIEEGILPDVVLKPHDLVLAEDVQIALKVEKGPNAILESFAMEDFTTRGDNYACIVSSVKVAYKQDDNLHHTTFIVKLNPCRGNVGFGQMTGLLFAKETYFYTVILPQLNKELRKLNQPVLDLPNYYHSVKIPNREVIFLEDMRKRGFRMCDRMKGMDEKHTLLIMRELARLHASSMLYLSRDDVDVEELRKSQNFKEFFEVMAERTPGMNISTFFNEHVSSSARVTDRIEGYSYVSDFLRKTQDEKMTERFQQLLMPLDKFCAIGHGDCWNNNFLFRYDETNTPVECRLLDFQIIRIGSPALDMNYMFYCSLTGEMRKKHINDFFVHYYAEFASIMSLANKPTPFTLQELKDEFYSKNFFGLLMGLMLIPIVLVDPQDAPSLDNFKSESLEENLKEFQDALLEVTIKSKILKPRFLSMFDEMKDSGLFDESDPTAAAINADACTENPYDLVERNHVELALENAKGLDAILQAFKIEQLLQNKGDNYATTCCKVRAQYIQNDEEGEVSFFVKLNPCRSGGMRSKSELLFEREIDFYTKVLPNLEKELKLLGYSRLALPFCYYSVSKKSREVLYLQDMSNEGFRMCDRTNEMDAQHTNLIMKELAKFHASSAIWMFKHESNAEDLRKNYISLKEIFYIWLESNPKTNLNQWLSNFFGKAKQLVERNKDYQFVTDYLEKKIDSGAEKIFRETLEYSDTIKVICLGDCWNNNFLFKYNSSGTPIECCLVDLQMTRLASPALDLNLTLYCNMDGDTRKKYIEEFFMSYYSTFASLIASAEMVMPFTLTQLQEEFKTKNFFGLVMGLILIPITFMKPEDAQSINEINVDNMHEAMQRMFERIFDVSLRSPNLAPRMLSMFDDMKENGLFNSD